MTSIETGYSKWAVVDGRPADLSFLPPKLKKRLTPTVSMALDVAHHCVGDGMDNIRSVFGSRYGEYNRTCKMLSTLLGESMISPAAFSLSTHNVPSGVYSKNTGNKAGSTTISALTATLEATFLEAAMMAQQYLEPILFLYVDTPLPEIYRPEFTSQENAIALGILLRHDSEKRIRLSWQSNERSAKPASGVSTSARKLYKILEGTTSSGFSIDDGRLDWIWEAPCVRTA